jgi:hypothetical protein
MNNPLTAGSRPGGAHKRSKSSASVLKSMISSRSIKGKENTTPPSTASSNDQPPRTPIWAEFASNSSFHHQTQSTNKMPLNDRSVQQEINLYTPADYSPSKQMNFFDIHQPALAKKDRPKSEHFPKSKSTNFILETFSRTSSNNSSKNDKSTKTSKVPLKGEGATAQKVSRPLLTMAKRGTRVMGLIAAFNSKTTPTESEMDPMDIDAQFEAVLVRPKISVV